METVDKCKGCDRRVTQYGHLAGSSPPEVASELETHVQVYCKAFSKGQEGEEGSA